MAKIIVETAKEKGSEDNISCIVIELNKKLHMNKQIFVLIVKVDYILNKLELFTDLKLNKFFNFFFNK